MLLRTRHLISYIAPFAKRGLKGGENMSKNISEEIKILQQELKELKCWIKENWNSLPDVVQTMIARGQLETQNRIEQLKNEMQQLKK